ncbi:hypothetical protein NUU61_008279 [Penicillium alfredii]|uniref:DNA 3'-5' helicase n=1 Tax=Penicillium alfredii TaxID=1506179 RepID=A0A9W9JZW2_9EURO|nr:uncharacterized protein NUU61_008279 [Penicillium alfredii]KAJ5086972.1 hypothetical protein NUU61_008279 [Penicillium alfredii]
MRRKPPFSQPRPFKPPSQRRGNDLASPTSSQSCRAGVIDQRLVAGSQQPQYSTSFPRESATRPISVHDEDSQLDAFDLELLGQGTRVEAPHQEFGFPTVTPLQESSFPLEHQNAARQVSRFFHPNANSTPLRGHASSSSDTGPASPASPLMMLHQRKEGSWLGRGRPENNRDPYQYEPIQSSPQPASSHASAELSAGIGQRQGFSFDKIPLSVRGIVLVPVNDLPETHRTLFPFPLFNAIQSKCFQPVYNTNDNIVLSAPTGSGKTVIMELAICRLLNTLKDERFKVIYQAPTKSLCAERFRDWNSRLSALDLKCAELTGDTDYTLLRSVQNSQIIITTPEKWDSMTRKWKDHMRLMQLVKLFLIDEVHILKETRGATLEAVVSRMKNIGSNVRFVALSATVPNSEDIATWLGKDATNQHVPAHREHFGEEFRPVKLRKFVYGYQSTLNEFAFDKVCGSKLPDVIGMHSSQKPIMIFCCTRNSSATTAKELARLWTMTNPPARLWKGPNKRIETHNEDLKTTIAAGVAFHHAGLSPADRHAIETGFLGGHINVICCTSTLAVGINLPCHFVIIKNTVGWQEGGCKEYSDLEIMQMLGRAGRPQFDGSATAVILTRKERVSHYERLVSGSESLESCLHLHLIDHLNAEIGLGHVTDVDSAVKWLAGTFLFVRLRRNPTHYKLKESANQDDEEEMLRHICEKDITLLQEYGLVSTEGLRSTPFGDTMARYYVRFETMKTLLSLRHQATLSQILDVISQAEEFREVRLKAGEKSLYREINRNPGIRYSVKVDIALPAHKISLLLQSELGAIEFPDAESLQKHKFQFQQDKSIVLSHVKRLIRCVVDCLIAREDSIAIRNALELARSFGAKVWDQSPLQMKQIDQVGIVAVRKLAAAGITSIEVLEGTEAHRIEVILSKNPPFGAKLLARLKDFPKLRVVVKMMGRDIRAGAVNIRFKAEIAFMNDRLPTVFQRRPIYVCCLTEISDGRMVDFRRISASKLQDGLEVVLIAELKSADQYIVCHVMCDDIGMSSLPVPVFGANSGIAGTWRQAEIRPGIPSHLFPPKRDGDNDVDSLNGPRMNMSRPRNQDKSGGKPKAHEDKDDFDGDDLQLDDFLAADQRTSAGTNPSEKTSQVQDTDWISIDNSTPSPLRRVKCKSHTHEDEWITDMGQQDGEEYEPIRLPNGRWACNHKCRDKTSCKHFCCREGLEKPPKPSKRRVATQGQKNTGLSQLMLPASMTKQESSDPPKKDGGAAKQHLTGKTRAGDASKTKTSRLQKASHQTQAFPKSIDKLIASPAKTKQSVSPLRILSSDYSDDGLEDLPSPSRLLAEAGSSFARPDSPVVRALDPMERFSTRVTDGTANAEHQQPCSIDITGPKSTLVTPLEKQTEIFQPSKDCEIIEIWDDSPSDSGNAQEPSLVGPLNPSESAPLLSVDANVIQQPKRKSSSQDDINDSITRKRRTLSRLALQFRHDSSDSEPMSVNTADKIAVNGIPVEWNDIDPLLLDEFKDIINFF